MRIAGLDVCGTIIYCTIWQENEGEILQETGQYSLSKEGREEMVKALDPAHINLIVMENSQTAKGIGEILAEQGMLVYFSKCTLNPYSSMRDVLDSEILALEARSKFRT